MRLTTRDYLLATVAYADIFDYPLTEDDIYYWCIKKTPKSHMGVGVIRGVSKRGYFIFLKGREAIVNRYNKKRQSSKEKWKIARSVGRVLQWIPSILLVGVTGGVAVNNASRKDDIDLFIITARKTMWITRLLIIPLLALLGRRRTPNSDTVMNKICVNMFMSEEALGVKSSEQDLFAAHEVLQMEPLWSRKDTYRRFLQANKWTKVYLPVAWSIKQVGRNQHPKVSYWWTRITRSMLRLFELPSKHLQLWYMRNRRTSEIVTDSVLRFHPNDARVWIKAALTKRLTKYNIPIDNIFYDR
jgi:hypothetical protein